MSVQVITWDTGKTKDEVRKRFRNASEARSQHEDRWRNNERTVYSTTSPQSLQTNALENDFQLGLTSIDSSEADVNVSYTFKNFRFIHAQMSANPPSVAMRPTSSDQDDHRKADAADRISRWALRQYRLQEKQDQMNLHCLLYGTGVMKTVWDSTRGDILEFNPDTNEMKLEGDISICIPFIWNIYLDPDAKSMDEVKWIFERIYMDYEEACNRWPDKQDFLKQARVDRNQSFGSGTRGKESALQDNHYNCVELLEYWETGLPTNGYLGRYCITTIDGEVIEAVRPSPFRFRRAGAVSRIEAKDIADDMKEKMTANLPEQAQLPYHILTDIDIPNMVWGRSAVEYAAGLQDNLSRLDSARLDNIQAAGANKLILPEGSEIADESLSNTPWDVVRITGTQPPFWQSPAQMMPEMTAERQTYIQGIDAVMGMNDAMQGIQSREQSGASMQIATNQGNMIRRRLFNKYVMCVESEYRAILNLIRKHWTVNRTIHVLGKEKALQAIDIKGADIDGGYDIIGEYGVTLSLDPITRREEILTLQPLFEKAGVPARTSMKMLKLNEIEGMFDELELADSRQKEIFDYMIGTGSYVAPKKYRDHVNMIAWAMRYFMTQEFNALDEEIQALCERHTEERANLAAMESSGGATGGVAGAAPEQSPGPIPSQPAGPVPAPSTGPVPQG